MKTHSCRPCSPVQFPGLPGTLKEKCLTRLIPEAKRPLLMRFEDRMNPHPEEALTGRARNSRSGTTLLFDFNGGKSTLL